MVIEKILWSGASGSALALFQYEIQWATTSVNSAAGEFICERVHEQYGREEIRPAASKAA